MARERLQKILAHAGLASRRSAEALISAGKVRVNGLVVSELGASADPRKDKIEVEGKRIVLEKPVYYVLHKPRGMVTTLSDPEGRPHLGEVLKKIDERVYPVGRLDFHTSGVLLVTNDGELTEALLHPRKDVPKIYVAKLRGFVEVEELDKLRNGVVLDDGHKTKKAEVFVLREEERNTWVQITLHEGKNRQIHRMGDAIGHPVLRLARISFAGITAEGLRPGEWRELDARELDKLKKAYITPLRQSKDRELEQSMRAAAKARTARATAAEPDEEEAASEEPRAPKADRGLPAPSEREKAPRATPSRATPSRGTWAEPRGVATREGASESSAPRPAAAPRAKATRATKARGTWAEPREPAAGAESSAPRPAAAKRGAKASGPSAAARGAGGEARGAKPRDAGSESRGAKPYGAGSESRGAKPRGGSESRGAKPYGASSESRGAKPYGASSESRGAKPRGGSESRGAKPYGGGSESRGTPSYSRDSGPPKSRDASSRGGPSQRGAASGSRGASAPRPSGPRSRREEAREMPEGAAAPRGAKPRGDRGAAPKPRTPRSRRS